MTAWMTGINQRSDLHAYGEVLKVMMRPMPRVAAEIASGSENIARGAELLAINQRGPDAAATNKARGTQMQAVAKANTSEVMITDCGETDRAGNEPEKMERHAESESWLFTMRDL